MEYNREKAVEYAHKWAFERNPAYYNFEGIGGDCTNFISQCIHAGGAPMNYTKDVGWYYSSPNNRSAAWSSVHYLYKFLTTNKGVGPYGKEAPITNAEIGDVIQLSFDGNIFAHSLFIVSITDQYGLSAIRTATHSFNADNRPVSTYNFELLRLIHIEGIRN